MSFKKKIKQMIPNEQNNWRNKLRLYRKIAKHVSTDDKTILFQSSVGRNYSGNTRYIYEEMIRQGLDKKYKCYWVFEKSIYNQIDLPGNGVKLDKSSFKFLYTSLKSKYWIFDTRQPNYLQKPKDTVFIETWHGTPLKKLALDMEKVDMSGNTNIKQYRKRFKKHTSQWDYLVSQNSYSTEIFRRAFAFNGNMLEIGYPRNDILFRENTEEGIKKIKEKMNIPKDKKVILYAPTWRDNEFHKNGIYKFATDMDFNLMKERLGDDYVLIVKYHYSVRENINWDEYAPFVIECNELWDIQELYLISDILITDYSSVMFDYAILKRPMLFFTYDLEFYKNNLRDFYFDMVEEVPGPIVRTTEELIYEIEAVDESYMEKYSEKYEKFTAKYNEFDDGNASNEIIKLLK
ncbi:MAG: CDP-glycerol glycerophosphotransferase family protein [archaeon]|nr:CDP-glycerol glycerophosphotransferase family protein [archaeon]